MWSDIIPSYKPIIPIFLVTVLMVESTKMKSTHLAPLEYVVFVMPLESFVLWSGSVTQLHFLNKCSQCFAAFSNQSSFVSIIRIGRKFWAHLDVMRSLRSLRILFLGSSSKSLSLIILLICWEKLWLDQQLLPSFDLLCMYILPAALHLFHLMFLSRWKDSRDHCQYLLLFRTVVPLPLVLIQEVDTLPSVLRINLRLVPLCCFQDNVIADERCCLSSIDSSAHWSLSGHPCLLGEILL